MCNPKCIYILAYTACKLYSKESEVLYIHQMSTSKVCSGNVVTWYVLCSFTLSIYSIHWTAKSPFYK